MAKSIVEIVSGPSVSNKESPVNNKKGGNVEYILTTCY